jgi:excinuclease UvrABC nuclease subunit
LLFLYMSNSSDFVPLKLDTSSINLPDIPTGTGIYIFRDKAGKALYVGKAKNLRNRLASYFRKEDNHDPRIALMLRQAVSVEYADS